MDLVSFRALLTPFGQAALQDAAALQPSETDYLRLFGNLRQDYPAEIARAALETAILRRAAVRKFPAAEQMYFTREALEQATSDAVASYRSQRYKPFSQLVDLGCSIGGDLLALAHIAPTLGIDIDPLRLAIAQANAAILGLGQQVVLTQADLTHTLPLPNGAELGMFFDPARRSSGRRSYSVHTYQPSLERINTWLGFNQALGVKISPGVNLEEISAYPAEIEFISMNGELKEAVLWFGPLKTTRRRATLLPGPHTMVSIETNTDNSAPRLPIGEPGSYLYEPDPAVLRAGLVQDLGRQLDAAQLDPDIAYLTTNALLPTHFGRCWSIDAWFPFQLKRLREALHHRKVGEVIVKKRGSPLEPEELIRQLRLSGDEKRVVFLTHLRGRPIAILAYDEINQRVRAL